ncbi:interleukin-9 receptor-like protein [Labeo rohita]|uniref:Interleukin-9 receptor-like protein n=1 Tax=Labeo rohita TaxID=84645 RepID=A0A498MU30_LABRO|nr:interleukin-9 receptor-like protein [Labeo rohita]RXN21806.1 interleukin-9 receptor-like protein [Labeo rohita]
MHCSPFIFTLVYFSDILGNFITWGDQYSLECLSNYLSNITCSLNISAESLANESSYWLQFSSYEERYDCTLKMGEQSLLCELDLSQHLIFTDVDSYSISLHSGYYGNNFSVVLDADFMPHEHKETPGGSFQSYQYLLLLPLLLVLLTCIPYSRWRKNDYIPSPAPYFRDWKGDVQVCSVLSGKMRDIMQGEESLEINILTESTDTPSRPTSLDYEKMGEIDEHESPSMPQSPVGSEVDSGCWIRDFITTERGSITCSEDYCTLSTSHTFAF